MSRVVLLSDQPILAEGLHAVIAANEGFQLVATCVNMSGLMQMAVAEHPDILLMDLTSEVTFGALTELKKAVPESRIVLWVHNISTELALQAMGLGIRGILRKTLPTDLLIKCLQKIHEGELWFEKALTDSFLTAKRVSLTQREGQLVNLLSQGLKNKEIATALMISEGTVKVYLSRLFQKLGVKDRFELALYGLKNLTAGQGAVDRTARPADRAGEAGARTVPSLRSIVLERVPERPPAPQNPYQFARRVVVRQ